MGNTAIFLLQIAFFLLDLIARGILKQEKVFIIGLVIMIVGTVGPLALLGLYSGPPLLTVGVLGGLIPSMPDVICVFSLIERIKS